VRAAKMIELFHLSMEEKQERLFPKTTKRYLGGTFAPTT
jgi:hypothetical protein